MRYAIQQKKRADMNDHWDCELWACKHRVPSVISSCKISEASGVQSALSGRDDEDVVYENYQNGHEDNASKRTIPNHPRWWSQ